MATSTALCSRIRQLQECRDCVVTLRADGVPQAPSTGPRRRYTLCVNPYAADFSTGTSVTFASSLIAAPWAAGS